MMNVYIDDNNTKFNARLPSGVLKNGLYNYSS